MENTTERRWTVIYLINVDSDLWEMAKRMFSDILALKINPKTSVIICLKTQANFMKEMDPHFQTLGPDTTEDITFFFSIEALEQPLDGQKSSMKVIGRKKDFDVKNPKHIEWYFTSFILDQYPASKYLLFTWGHGGAYGLFPKGNILKSKIDKPAEAKKWDMLSISDLGHAITSAFGLTKTHKIDLVIMMNCFMQLFDTGLTLSQAGVNYLVAPENLENAIGYNYTEIFKKLYDGSEIDSLDLAKLAVTSLNSTGHQNETEKENEYQRETAFSVNNLHLYPQLSELIDKVSVLLIDQLKMMPDEIDSAVNACFEWGGSNYPIRDFFRFIEKIKKITGFHNFNDLFRQIDDLKDKIVLEKFRGYQLKTDFPEGYPLGLAVSLPNCEEGGLEFYITYMKKDSPYATDFAKHYKWSLFVEEYLQTCSKKNPLPKENLQ
jgi:Clostripain family